jgi:flagellar basal body-associated protein FliL
MRAKLLIGLIVILVIFAIIGVILATSLSNKTKTSTTKTPVSTSFPSPSPLTSFPPAAPVSSDKEAILKSLPVKTDEFNIEYYASDGTILVTIKKEPVDKSRKDSEKWFTDKGIKDFAKYNIQWIVSPDLMTKPLYQ